jgi:hypothetical protein
MSIFLIPIMASNARLAAARSGSVIAAVRTRGVICHDSPHLSSKIVSDGADRVECINVYFLHVMLA